MTRTTRTMHSAHKRPGVGLGMCWSIVRSALLLAVVAGAVALARPALAQRPSPWLPSPAAAPTPASQAPADETPADAAPETLLDENKTGEPAFVTLAIPESVSVGKPLIGQVDVRNAEDRPLDNKVLLINVNGEVARRMRTDAEGKAQIRISEDVLPVGDYTIEVVTEATQAYREATAEGAFTVRPAIVKMITVPPSPGVTFLFDGQIFVTAEDGVAQLIANKPGIYDVELIVPEELAATDERGGLEFVRWDDDQFLPKRTIEVYGDMDKHVGLARSYMIGLTFLDRNGATVDPERIEEVVFKASTGTRYTVTSTQPRPLTSNRVARLNAGLVPTEVQYGIESVLIDGANVVNQNQQRFTILGDATWPVDLLLYDAKVRAADAFFGFPVGTGISLTYPSGREEFIAFNEDDEAVTHNLARGVYKIQVQGVGGMAPLTPVVISRNQDATLKVLTNTDMAAAGTAGALGALGLLLLGRPHLTRLGRKRRAARPVAVPQLPATLQAVETPKEALPAVEQTGPALPGARAQRKQKPAGGRRNGLPVGGYRQFKAMAEPPDAAGGKQKPHSRSIRS